MQSIISQERKCDFVVMSRSTISLGSIILKLYHKCGDGTCQYLSNKIQKMELDIPVYEEY